MMMIEWWMIKITNHLRSSVMLCRSFSLRELQILSLLCMKSEFVCRLKICCFIFIFTSSLYIFWLFRMLPYTDKTLCNPVTWSFSVVPKINSGLFIMISTKNPCWRIASGLSKRRGKNDSQYFKYSGVFTFSPWFFIIFPIEAIELSLQCPKVFYFSPPFGILLELIKQWSQPSIVSVVEIEFGVLSANTPSP